MAGIDARLAHRGDDREQPAHVSRVPPKVAHERAPSTGVRTVPEGIHVAGRRAGALAIAAARSHSNKIVPRFRARRTCERRRDDGRDGVRERVRPHPPHIGMNSEMGI